MDFNKVFEQMFNNQNNSGGNNFNPMQYADMLKGFGSGAGSGLWLIILLLLLCCCGCGNLGNYGGGCGCNNQCYDLCCRRKNRCCKKFKNYECYLNPCSCNNCCNNNSCGFGGCSWIWIIILIVLLCGFRKGGVAKSPNSSGRASNIINVDTAE